MSITVISKKVTKRLIKQNLPPKKKKLHSSELVQQTPFKS